MKNLMNVNVENKQATMSSLEISDVIESRHDSVKRTMERLENKGIIQLTPTVEVNHKGQSVTVYHVNKRDSYVVVAQLSPEFTARLVDRWEALETGKAQPIATQMLTGIPEKIFAGNLIMDSLNLQGSSRTGAMKRYLKKYHPDLLEFMPDYSVDAPIVSGQAGSESSEVSYSLTELLKRKGVPMTAASVNKLLIKEELLEEKLRPSSKGGVKAFKCITEEGLAYGKNMVSDQSPRETQPQWYESTFDDLLDRLNLVL